MRHMSVLFDLLWSIRIKPHMDPIREVYQEDPFHHRDPTEPCLEKSFDWRIGEVGVLHVRLEVAV